MDNLPLISVIVPVYKVEQYLDRCVESIVNQTYSNLEIILVDDGSPDNCPAMCDAWAARDSRIRVIHKENGGLSDARNAGMAVASGELTGFIDSDDWIRTDMYQLLWENMRQHSSDISACGVEMVFEDGSPSRMLTRPGNCVLNTEDALLTLIEETKLKQPVWYKLYKTALIVDLRFPVGRYHEDAFWTYQAVGRAGRISVFDAPCYYYTQRAGSIMGAGYSLKRLDALEAKRACVGYMEKHCPRLVTAACIDLWSSCIYVGQMLLRHCEADERASGMAVVNAALRACPIRLNAAAHANAKQYIWLLMARCSFIITCRIRNMLRIGM